jgi:hypothetical protein
MSITNWLPMVAVAIPATWLAIANWRVIVRRKRREGSSIVPVLGGVLGAFALALAPIDLRQFLWLPFILDYGSIPWLVSTLLVAVSRKY